MSALNFKMQIQCLLGRNLNQRALITIKYSMFATTYTNIKKRKEKWFTIRKVRLGLEMADEREKAEANLLMEAAKGCEVITLHDQDSK